jgi:hypothetical protein
VKLDFGFGLLIAFSGVKVGPFAGMNFGSRHTDVVDGCETVEAAPLFREIAFYEPRKGHQSFLDSACRLLVPREVSRVRNPLRSVAEEGFSFDSSNPSHLFFLPLD